ncbi:MAG: NAD(P)/FAD-dependent oxidoreductase [Pseudomonadota bacterium]
MTKNIVVVGGGLGGLMLATRLGRQLKSDKDHNVILIDRAPVHVWKPMLHSFAAGTANAHEDGIPFLAQARRAGFTYMPGEFYAIDRRAKHVGIRLSGLGGTETDTTLVPYDVCVIAIGSSANDFQTPGVAEHCHYIDNLWRADALNAAIRREIVRCAVRGGDITIGIVGGGATGIEFAAETAQLVDVGAAYSGIPLHKRLRLTLLNSEDRLLNGFPEELAGRVSQKLSELGVELRMGARVTRADETGFVLADDSHVKADVRVWTAGVKASAPLSNSIDLECAPSGQILVSPTLQSKSDPSVFSMGDCARFAPEGSDRPLPPTGQVARQQADHLYDAILAHLGGRELPKFDYHDAGSLVSLSQYGAYGTLGGKGVLPSIAIQGWFAKKAHRLFYRVHQFGLYGPVRGLIVMLRDALNGLVKPPVRFD